MKATKDSVIKTPEIVAPTILLFFAHLIFLPALRLLIKTSNDAINTPAKGIKTNNINGKNKAKIMPPPIYKPPFCLY